jgi:hypothetical protein
MALRSLHARRGVRERGCDWAQLELYRTEQLPNELGNENATRGCTKSVEVFVIHEGGRGNRRNY